MKERLVEIVNRAKEEYAKDVTDHTETEYIVECLLNEGVIVQPDELYSIVDKGTIYASISKAIVDWLPLYVIKNPEKYGYYKTREEAEQKLKERDSK